MKNSSYHRARGQAILVKDGSSRQYDKSDKPQDQTTTQTRAAGCIIPRVTLFATKEGGKK